MNEQFKKAAVFCMIGLASMGLDAPSDVAEPSICGCRAPLASTAVLREVTGKVFVSQTEGMRPAQVDVSVSLPAKLLTGPSSTTTLKIGDTCTLSVPEKRLVRIEDEEGFWCVRAEAARPAGPLQAAPQSPVPISVLGILAGSKVMISIARKDERVSR